MDRINPASSMQPPDTSTVKFGAPSPIQPKFSRVMLPMSGPNRPSNGSNDRASSNTKSYTNSHVPFRTGYKPHDSLSGPVVKTGSDQAPSPSSYPPLALEHNTTKQSPIPAPLWRKDGLALPSFKKRPAAPRQSSADHVAVPTSIRVPREGDSSFSGHSNRPNPKMYDLTSRRIKEISVYPSPSLNPQDDERDEPYSDPAKATEHLKSFLDESFGGTLEVDEDSALLDGDVVQGLKCRLLPHQIAGVKFLRARESKKGKVKHFGGLLADDMGLGKTVQTMALIVTCPRPLDVPAIKSTLVVAPLSLIEQWAAEIKSKTSLSVCIYHGPSRLKNARMFGQYDVVMTTYNILVSEHNPSTMPRMPDIDDQNQVQEDRGVFGVRWWRIVLDEAHTIKNKAAKMSVGACALRSINRWALTGTPIQNTIDDLYTLLKFLRIEPLQHYNVFKEKISGPISRGKTKLAMKRLGAILSKVMIRRTKAVLNEATNQENAKFKLPPRTVKHIQVDFSPSEREFYSGLEARADKTLAQMKTSGDVGYMSVLVLLQRLRQACNHTQLVTKQLNPSEYKVDISTMSPTKKEDKQIDDLADLFSGVGVSPVKAETQIHSMKCGICLCTLSIKDRGGENCVDCTTAVVKARRVSAEHETLFGPSTICLDVSAKVQRLLRVLRDDEEPIDLDSTPASRKTIIFSQWTSMLDLIEPFLRAEKIGFTKYYGSMPNKLREQSLHSLKTDPATRVLLCSLKAGALGLNLTAASRIIMLDVWWNPQIEEQAIDRVHRIGQTREVLVYKLTVRDTVEDRILMLQERKRAIAKSALGEGGQVGQKLGLQELLALFRPEAEQTHDADDNDDDDGH